LYASSSPSFLFRLVSGESRGFVTFVKSNAKALLTLASRRLLISKDAVALSEGVGQLTLAGALPRRLRTAPQYSLPFEKGSRTASLNFITRRLAGEKVDTFSPAKRRVLPVAESKGVRVVFPAEISTRRYAPLTFSPHLVTVVSVVTVF